MHLAKNKWLQSQYKSALNYFEQAWTMARNLNDEMLLRSTANFNTFFLFWQGRYRDTVLDYEKSVPDVERFPFGRFPLLATMTVGVCYGQIGQVTQGIGLIDAIRRYCLDKGDIGLAAHSGTCIGAIMLDIGHVDDALQHLVPSVEEVKKIQPDWILMQGQLMLAYAYYLKGDNDKCAVYLRQFSRHGKQVHVSVRPWPYLMELCWAIEEGRLPPMLDLSIRNEVDQMIKGQHLCLKGVAYRFKALLQKKEGVPYERIITTLKRSIESLEQSGQLIELSKSRMELARLYLLQGNQKKSYKTAEEAFSVLSSLNENLIPDDLKPLMKDSAYADSLFREIIHVNQELISLGNNRDVIQHIISSANRITGAERGGIFLIDDSTIPPKLNLRASKNLTQDQIEMPDFNSSMKMITEVINHGKGLVQGLRVQENIDSPDEDLVLSAICVPIISKNNILGILYHDNRLLSNAFDKSQLEILSYLAAHIALVLQNDNLQEENDRLHNKLEELTRHYEKQNVQHQTIHSDEIVGESHEIKHVLSQVSQVAKTNTTVLILGETGVGKELVAKAIQRHSLRHDKPFISLNCSALSEKLIYSELFGHEKGSFTSADHRHIGRFEKAHAGTLFLDEIGDLPLDVQVRLLRVLETKEFERVGGKETISSDFRLIAATNRDLEQEVSKKRFRPDLFYRINVFPIYVPPLRDRRQDIPLLIRYFLKAQTQQTGKISRIIGEEEMLELTQYHWPGNVRELKNIVERYAISSSGSLTNMLSLLNVSRREISQEYPAVTLQENERRHVLWALDRTKGKIHGPGGAAELLDIHPNTLTFRIKKMGIKRSDYSRS